MNRPAGPSWSGVGLVALGGTVGTGSRYLLSSLLPHPAGVPVGTLAINVVGAFLLAWLLERLADHRVDAGWSRRIRLGVGTGVLGGFTTYSALAADTVLVWSQHPGLALAYALGTVVVGGLASVAGIGVGRSVRRRS